MSDHYIWVRCRVDGCTASGSIYTGDQTIEEFSDDQWEGETITATCKEHEVEA